MMPENFFTRRKTVAERTRISLETIEAVKKKLRKLPVKNPGKSVREAVESLARDFQNTLKKGYSLKELRGFLAEEKLTIPSALFKRIALGEQRKLNSKKGSEAGGTDAKTGEAPVHAVNVKPDTPEGEQG
jgi:hypothetical protein